MYIKLSAVHLRGVAIHLRGVAIHRRGVASLELPEGLQIWISLKDWGPGSLFKLQGDTKKMKPNDGVELLK